MALLKILLLVLFIPTSADAFVANCVMQASKVTTPVLNSQTKYPGWTTSSSRSGDGATDDANKIKVADESYALSSGSYAGGGSVTLPALSHRFTIPTGATIVGIAVEMKMYEQTGGLVSWTMCLYNNASTSNCKLYDGTIPNTATVATLGGPDDMWNYAGSPISLTPAQVNGSNFGHATAMIWNNSEQVGTKYIATDYYKMTVYYTGP